MADVTRLPGPNADEWEWQLQGSCRGKDPDLFFHPEGERGTSRSKRDLDAKAICRSCPVLLQCAAHALRVREPYGVWGGMTEDDRNTIYARAILQSAGTGRTDLSLPRLLSLAS